MTTRCYGARGVAAARRGAAGAGWRSWSDPGSPSRAHEPLESLVGAAGMVFPPKGWAGVMVVAAGAQGWGRAMRRTSGAEATQEAGEAGRKRQGAAGTREAVAGGVVAWRRSRGREKQSPTAHEAGRERRGESTRKRGVWRRCPHRPAAAARSAGAPAHHRRLQTAPLAPLRIVLCGVRAKRWDVCDCGPVFTASKVTSGAGDVRAQRWRRILLLSRSLT